MRRWKLASFVALVTLGLVALPMTPSSAAPIALCNGNLGNAPDGKIAIEGQSFTGGGYPSASINQSGTGQTLVWLMKWKNRTGATQVIRVKPGESGVMAGSGVTVSYSVDGVSVDGKLKPADTAKGLKFTVASGKWSPKVRVVVNSGNGSPAWFPLAGLYKGHPALECDMLRANVNNP